MLGVQSCKKGINLPAQVSKVGKATRQGVLRQRWCKANNMKNSWGLDHQE